MMDRCNSPDCRNMHENGHGAFCDECRVMDLEAQVVDLKLGIRIAHAHASMMQVALQSISHLIDDEGWDDDEEAEFQAAMQTIFDSIPKLEGILRSIRG